MIPILEVTRRPIDNLEYVKRSAEEKDYEVLLTDSVILTENGVIKAIYKNLDWDCSDLVSALKRIKYQESTRTSGLKTVSRIFGFAPRVPMRNDYCRISGLAQDSPAEHELITQYAQRVSDLYKEIDPTIFQKHETLTKEVNGEYVMKGSVFTSGIVNKNNPLKYHYDSGNFKDVYSCMLGFKSGVSGGYLSLPEYGVALEIKNNSVLIFDGQNILHGVTPIKLLNPDAYRYTMVFYSLRSMWECKPLNEELARIRNVKMGREIKRTETLGENIR